MEEEVDQERGSSDHITLRTVGSNSADSSQSFESRMGFLFEREDEDDEEVVEVESTSLWKKMTLKLENALFVSTSLLGEMAVKMKATFDRCRPTPQLSSWETETSFEPGLTGFRDTLGYDSLTIENEFDYARTRPRMQRMRGVGNEMSSTLDKMAYLAKAQQALSPEERKVLEYNSRCMKAKTWEGMIQKAESLRRKKDFLHLVLSYPMKPEADDEVSFPSLRDPFSCINRQVRQLQALLADDNYIKNGSELGEEITNGISEEYFRSVENILSKYDFHVVAYLPQEADIESTNPWSERIKVGLSRLTSATFEAPDEMLTVAVNSAIRQVSKYIEDGSLRKIGILGSGGEKVAKALEDMPVIIAKGSVILCVSVARHHSTEEVRQNIAAQVRGLQETGDISEGALGQVLPQDFILLLDCIDPDIDLHDLKIPDHGTVVVVTRSQNSYGIMDVDVEIRTDDHVLPWELFRKNVGTSLVDSSSTIQQMAVRLVKECHHHLLAIILLARALKDVTDMGVWEMALHELTSQSSSAGHAQAISRVMVHVLNFVWERKDIGTKYCINHLMLGRDNQRGDSTVPYWSNRLVGTPVQQRDSLVSDWLSNGLVETMAEANSILEDLINSFLAEYVGLGYVRMREETAIVLQNCCIPHLPSLYLREGGVDLTEARGDKKWNFMEIHLMGSKLSELPENPKCPALKTLWLDNNPELMEIPDLFFKDMPLLQSLDLSYTSIKSLPHSISNLVSLRTFNLTGCELLMELPSQIRALRNLEVFDLEGTEIMYLPQEMGELTSLRCFRVSLSGRANRYRVTKQMGTTIPTKVLSKLYQLVTLSIDVNPDGEWWEADVKAILSELSSLKRLKILELYLPSAELLQQLGWNSVKPMYPDLLRFRITVGRHPQRIISRLQREVEELVKKWEKSEKCLKYVNGEDTPTEITKALSHATVLFLDRHWTVKLLSKFGNENMVKLKFCLLVECNELQTIIDGDYEYPVGAEKKPVFERLHYLGIHYMKNLQSIWKGSIDKGCLSNLRSLALHTCPNLTTIFTLDLLGNLDKLEELVVEDCSKIKCLVSHEPCHSKPGHFLQSLKKVSLLDLPELVSISGGLSVGLVLESLVVYNCPKLESLYAMEVSSIDLKIKGEKEWWDKLKWHESEWSSNTRPAYEELRRGEDLMDQLAKDAYF